MAITKKEAEREFREIWEAILTNYPQYKNDTIAKREEWFIFVDSLRSEGRISKHQYNSWSSIC